MSNMRKAIQMLLGSCWSCLIVLQPSNAASEEGFLNSGIAKFNAGQYDAAVADLWRADSDLPRNATIHYYLGRAMEQLGKQKDALFHYQKASNYAAPGSEIQKHIDEALTGYKGESIFRPRQRNQAPGTGGLNIRRGYGAGVGGAAGSANSFYAPPATSSLISPATLGQPGHGGYGQSAPDYTSLRAQRDAERAARRAMREAARNVRRGSRGRRGRGYGSGSGSGSGSRSGYTADTTLPWRSAGTLNEAITLRREQADWEVSRINPNSPGAAMEIMRIKQQCERDCDQLRGAMGQSAASNGRQEAANNLQAQLQDQRLTGSGIRLMPNGTNLNVRNYEIFHSDQDDLNNQIPLIAKPQRLQDLEPSLRNSSVKR